MTMPYEEAKRIIEDYFLWMRGKRDAKPERFEEAVMAALNAFWMYDSVCD